MMLPYDVTANDNKSVLQISVFLELPCQATQVHRTEPLRAETHNKSHLSTVANSLASCKLPSGHYAFRQAAFSGHPLNPDSFFQFKFHCHCAVYLTDLKTVKTVAFLIDLMFALWFYVACVSFGCTSTKDSYITITQLIIYQYFKTSPKLLVEVKAWSLTPYAQYEGKAPVVLIISTPESSKAGLNRWAAH